MRRTVIIDGSGWVRRDMDGLSLREMVARFGLSLPIQTLANWDSGMGPSLDGLGRYLLETNADGALIVRDDGWRVVVERA